MELKRAAGFESACERFPDGQRDFREIFIVFTSDIRAIVRAPFYGIVKITFYGQAG